MAWTRRVYYCSAHAKSGEGYLDVFMQSLPILKMGSGNLLVSGRDRNSTLRKPMQRESEIRVVVVSEETDEI